MHIITSGKVDGEEEALPQVAFRTFYEACEALVETCHKVLLKTEEGGTIELVWKAGILFARISSCLEEGKSTLDDDLETSFDDHIIVPKVFKFLGTGKEGQSNTFIFGLNSKLTFYREGGLYYATHHGLPRLNT